MRALALLFVLAVPGATLDDPFGRGPHHLNALQDYRRAYDGAIGLRSKLPPARLAFRKDCVLKAVAAQRRRRLDAAKARPELLFESATPLQRFQEAIREQWHMVPEMFLNAYAVKTNEIFLIDDAFYYQRLGRTIDDSLAHEYAHYVQVVYENADLEQDPYGGYEQEAIALQTWFRERGAAALPADCRAP